MFRTAFALLVAGTSVQAKPLASYGPQPSLQVPPASSPGSAQGTAHGKLIRSGNVLPYPGTTDVVHQQLDTRSHAQQGHVEIGISHSEAQPFPPQQGTRTSSTTSAQSIQGSVPALPGSLPVVPVLAPAQPLNEFPVPGSGQAQGTAGGNIARGETQLVDGGSSTTVQQGASASGSASGGGFNIGRSSTGTQSLATQHGVSTKSDTDAHSMQGSLTGSFTGLQPLGGGLTLPQHQSSQVQPGHFSGHFPAQLPGHGSGSATGTAGSNIVRGETQLPGGGSSSTVSQGASAGGSASGGGFNVGKSSAGTQSLATQHGVSTKSDTDVHSVQGTTPGSSPGFQPLGGSLTLPQHHRLQVQPADFPGAFPGHLPGHGTGSASGTAGGNIVRGETQLPGGGPSSTVSQGFSAGGSASGGGFNVGSSSTGTESVSTQHGTSTRSGTDAHSMQGSLPDSFSEFLRISGGLPLPQQQPLQINPGQFLGLGPDGITGTGGGSLLGVQTVAPHGSQGSGTSPDTWQASTSPVFGISGKELPRERFVVSPTWDMNDYTGSSSIVPSNVATCPTFGTSAPESPLERPSVRSPWDTDGSFIGPWHVPTSPGFGTSEPESPLERPDALSRLLEDDRLIGSRLVPNSPDFSTVGEGYLPAFHAPFLSSASPQHLPVP